MIGNLIKWEVLVILYYFMSLQEQISTPKTIPAGLTHLYWRVNNLWENHGEQVIQNLHNV